ncbi:hypothetical protein KAR28_01490 [Candidatus Parcubacteria bacterium]|nr:hypothetical protein [Candidatus Parcubacteria bacterium]
MLKTKLKLTGTKLIITIVLALGLSVSFQSLLAAWTAPTAAPPDDNLSQPLDTSATFQTKAGGIGLAGNFIVDADTFVVDSVNNRVGIGTSSPQAQLHLEGDSGNAAEIVLIHNGPANVSSAGITFNVANDASPFSIKSHDNRLRLAAGVGNVKMVMMSDGRVGIGTENPTVNAKLHVNGGNIRVTGGSFIDDGTTLNVPDYVFDSEYNLKSLSEVEKFILKHKHLENFPDMDDTEGWAGLSMQDRDMKLLEKIEELTLYIIKLEKKVTELENKK